MNSSPLRCPVPDDLVKLVCHLPFLPTFFAELKSPFSRPFPQRCVFLNAVGLQRHSYICSAIWGYVDYTTPNTIHTVDQIFNTGLSGGKDRPMLGHRPLISSNPLKYADHYVWETYGEVDTKRRALGSALDAMFAAKTLGGGEYKTLGLWSMNRPGRVCLDIPYL
jgi:hypothetical protein